MWGDGGVTHGREELSGRIYEAMYGDVPKCASQSRCEKNYNVMCYRTRLYLQRDDELGRRRPPEPSGRARRRSARGGMPEDGTERPPGAPAEGVCSAGSLTGRRSLRLLVDPRRGIRR